MARASTPTILPLDTFAKLAGIHPLHFNQVYVPNLAPTTTCDMPLTQYSWQDADRIGREEVAQTISQVEQLLTNLLGFKVGPTWEADERQPFPQAVPKGAVWGSYNIQGQLQSVQTDYGYLITPGTEALALVQAGAAITYSDVDGDGYDELATIVVATSLTNSDEIILCYPGHEGEAAWEVRPVHVSITGGNATITCRREQLVLESLQEALKVQAVNGLDDANFLTTADVYRRYNDPSQQGMFMWETNPCGCWLYGCATCQFYVQSACARIRDKKLGFLALGPATWDEDAQDFTTERFSIGLSPSQVRLWYKAGGNLEFWQAIITRLTLSLLDRPFCACKPLEAAVQYQKEDFALESRSPGSGRVRWQVGKRVLDNPIGTTRAAVNAWPVVQANMLVSS